MTDLTIPVHCHVEDDGVFYVDDRDALKAWIVAWAADNEPHTIHNFCDTGLVLAGADHSVDSVLRDVDQAEHVAVMTGDARRGNYNHALALILPPEDHPFGRLPRRLEIYDIGDVSAAVAVRDGA